MPSVCTRERYTYDSERKIDTFGDWPVILIKKVHTNISYKRSILNNRDRAVWSKYENIAGSNKKRQVTCCFWYCMFNYISNLLIKYLINIQK